MKYRQLLGLLIFGLFTQIQTQATPEWIKETASFIKKNTALICVVSAVALISYCAESCCVSDFDSQPDKKNLDLLKKILNNPDGIKRIGVLNHYSSSQNTRLIKNPGTRKLNGMSEYLKGPNGYSHFIVVERETINRIDDYESSHRFPRGINRIGVLNHGLFSNDVQRLKNPEKEELNEISENLKGLGGSSHFIVIEIETIFRTYNNEIFHRFVFPSPSGNGRFAISKCFQTEESATPEDSVHKISPENANDIELID
jgi:hypothetical protein